MIPVALISPDKNAAQRAIEAGYERVRVHNTIIPCRTRDALYIYGVSLRVYLDGADRRNMACYDRSSGQWILIGKFEGL